MTSQRQQGGSQRNWDEVRKQSDLPIITIITSTFSVVQDLHRTIGSIKKQTYPNIQWIIADGASTDGTVSLLEANSELIDYWFSEPDTGIYDAWNKALEHVKGDWVQFIGAGDELYETDTLEKVADYLKDAYPTYELVYGKVMHVSEKSRTELYVSGEPWEGYKGKWEGIQPKLPMHPAIFHHSTLFINKLFNTQYKIVADTHFLIKALESKNMLYMPFIIDVMPIGGTSSSLYSSFEVRKELKVCIAQLNITPPILNIVKEKTKSNIKKVVLLLPEKKAKSFIDFCRVLIGKPKVWTVK